MFPIQKEAVVIHKHASKKTKAYTCICTCMYIKGTGHGYYYMQHKRRKQLENITLGEPLSLKLTSVQLPFSATASSAK
jgi:hypothetical protein